MNLTEEKVKEISKDFGIDFNRACPFEDYGSSEETSYMRNFFDYYRELLINDGVNVDNAIVNYSVEELSDGKYLFLIEPQISGKFSLDINAWDNVEDVIQNVRYIEDSLSYEIDNERYERKNGEDLEV